MTQLALGHLDVLCPLTLTATVRCAACPAVGTHTQELVVMGQQVEWPSLDGWHLVKGVAYCPVHLIEVR